MPKWARQKYQVKNLDKYAGKRNPTCRSSWEIRFCMFCDNNPAVIQWASEPIRIPYTNPLTGKDTTYVPDFLIVYIDKNQKKHAELIEIKPDSQSTMDTARSAKDKYSVVLNAAKWAAAQAWCAQQGIRFRVINEHHIFENTR